MVDRKDMEDALAYYKQILDTDGIDDVSKLNTIIKISLIYKENGDLDNALSYALMGCTKTFSPRADLCCLLGDIYKESGNALWAENWYKNAIGNIPMIGEENSFKKEYLMKVPMLKLSMLYYENERYEEGMECVDSVLKINPDDEDAQYNKGKLLEKISN